MSPSSLFSRASAYGLSLIIVALGHLAAPARAQLGVTPSQNAAFLSELQAHDPDFAEAGRDVLGDARQMLEDGRALLRPAYFSTSITAAQHLFADFTGFSSQYQLGRSYLTPWYDGVRAPQQTMGDSAAGWSLGMALEQNFEYNSAVFGGTVISSTYLLLDGSYKLADNQRLTLSGGVGLNRLFEGDSSLGSSWAAKWGLTFLPGTSIAYDIDLGPVFVTFYDRFSMRTNVFNPAMVNDLGVAATWQIADHWKGTLNYNYSMLRSVADRVSWVPLAQIQSVLGMLTYDIDETWSVGAEGGLNGMKHETGSAFNNATLWNLGGFVSVNLNKDSRLRFAVGYQNLDFKGRPGGIDDTSDQSAPYYTLSYSARLSDRLSHELALGYESQLDTNANYNSSHYANYGITAAAWQGARITASVFVEQTDESPSVVAENFTSWGFDLHLAQQVTSKFSVSFGYSFARLIIEDARANPFFTFSDYPINQHAVGLNAAYTLNDKVQFTLNCAEIVSNYPRAGQDNDQQRISLGVRLQF